MSFLSPYMLWLLVLVPVLINCYILAQRRRKRYALRYSSISLVKDALGRGPGIRRHIPPALFLTALAVMVAAVARPVATVTLPSRQSTVILAIDVSGSMHAADLKPTRMEAAKSAARAFVEKQPRNVRIGVVSFTDNAAIVQAPTADREPVLAAINRLVPQRGTGIGRGILTSLEAIFEPADGKQGASGAGPGLLPSSPSRSEPAPAGGYAAAAIVLLSDGQSNVGPPPLEVVGEAVDRGVRIYTVGVGQPEGTVLEVEGRSIRVRLDEETLKAIAARTSAAYFQASDEAGLVNIYDGLSTRLVLKLEQTEVTAAFTGLAALLLVIAGTLSLLWFNRLP